MFMAVLRGLSQAKGAGHRLSRQCVRVRLIVCVCACILGSLYCLLYMLVLTHTIIQNILRRLQKALKAFECNSEHLRSFPDKKGAAEEMVS